MAYSQLSVSNLIPNGTYLIKSSRLCTDLVCLKSSTGHMAQGYDTDERSISTTIVRADGLKTSKAFLVRVLHSTCLPSNRVNYLTDIVFFRQWGILYASGRSSTILQPKPTPS